jgi:hypothetical protein
MHAPTLASGTQHMVSLRELSIDQDPKTMPNAMFERFAVSGSLP